jgi:hypothetical protein
MSLEALYCVVLADYQIIIAAAMMIISVLQNCLRQLVRYGLRYDIKELNAASRLGET